MRQTAIIELRAFRAKVMKILESRGEDPDMNEIVESLNTLEYLIRYNLIDDLKVMRTLKNIREQEAGINQ